MLFSIKSKASHLAIKKALLILFLITPCGFSFGQTLLHNFEFNNNLNDTRSSGVSLTESNTSSSSFGSSPNSWTWTQGTAPGGGLDLLTDQLPDATNYSLGFRIEFDQTTSGYRKIITFKGSGSDNGLYFYNGNLVLFPGGSSATSYSANTFYDFVLTRASDNTFRIYTVSAGTATLVYDITDTNGDAIPVLSSGDRQFRFFMNDSDGRNEHASGGTVRSIRMWDTALTAEEIEGALSSAVTHNATTVMNTGATLEGEVNPQGSLSTFSFEWGTSNLYGNTMTSPAPSSSSSSTSVSISASLTGLVQGQTYHYRIKSSSGSGDTFGKDKVFTTNRVPVTVCSDYILQLDASGNGAITTGNIDDGSSDPDGDGFTLSLDKMAFTVADVGGNAVILTATDSLGNEDACTATVTVIDNVAPGGVLANLDLWLKSDAGTSAIGTSWQDQSSQGNNYTTASGPTVVANALNYNDGVEILNGGFDAPAGAALTADWSVFFISKKLASDLDGRIFDGNAGNYLWAHHSTNRNGIYLESSPSDHAASYTTGSGIEDLHLHAYTRESSGALEARTDGLGLQSHVSSNSASGIRININRNGGELSDSRVGEMIIYDRKLSATEVNKVESYLGIKYSVSLSSDYTASDDTQFWDASLTPSYQNGIVGIGKDSGNDLIQKQSQSTNDDFRIYIDDLAVGNTSNNGEISNNIAFVMIGNDNNLLSDSGSVEHPSGQGVEGRIDREWKVTNTNFSGSFSLDFKLSSSVSNVSKLRLLVDTDGDFTNAAILNPTISLSEGVVTVSGLSSASFPSDSTRYITLATVNEAPVITTTPLTAVDEDSLYLYAISATDNEDDDLVYAAPTKPSWMSLTSTLSSQLTYVVAPSFTTQSSSNITNFTIDITENFTSGDVISYTGSLPSGVSGSFDSAKGVYVFTGTASAAQWNTLLRTVELTLSTSSNAKRVVNFTENTNGNILSLEVNGEIHYYELIVTNPSSITWTNASSTASGKTFYGREGYLATVASQAEQTLIELKVSQNTWIGASDAAVEGEWRWVAGPESGTQFWQGLGNGSIVNGEYNNWSGGEPNDSGGEDYAHMFANGGLWNDFSGTNSSAKAYLVEYGGMAGDNPLNITQAFNVRRLVSYRLTGTPLNADVGVHAVSISVSDGVSTTVQNFTVTVTNTNDIPTASNNVLTINEDSTQTFSAGDFNYSDVDVGDSLDSIIITSLPSVGTLKLSNVDVVSDQEIAVGDIGDLVFRPFTNANGTAYTAFNFRVNDGEVSAVSSNTMTLNVTPVNDAPIIIGTAGTEAFENITYSYTASVADDVSSNNGVDLVWSLSGFPFGMTVSNTGLVTWTPTEGMLSTGTVTLTVTDNAGSGLADSEVFSFNVTPENDAPVAVAESYPLNEGAQLTVNIASGVLINDTDEDRDGFGAPIDTLSAVLVTGTSSGELNLNSDGSFTYKHDGSEVTQDSFSYQASDGVNVSNTVVVTLNISGVNDAPHAEEDTFTLDEGASLVLPMLANDTDAEGETLTIVIVIAPTSGAGTLAADTPNTGEYTYTHNGGQNFFDSFSYRVQDAQGAWSNTVLVNLNINPLNDDPVAAADSFDVAEDSGANPLNILANDTDEEGIVVLSSLRIIDEPLHGSVTLQIQTGIALYTPGSNYFGADSFTYSVSDLSAAFSAPATVSITVTAVNDQPTTLTDIVNVGVADTGTPVIIDVLANDDNSLEDDIDLAKLTIVSAPVNGTAIIIGSGTNPQIQYTPNANTVTVDSLKYTISDSATPALASNNTDVHINLIVEANQPKALPDVFNDVETDGSTTYIIDVLANDTAGADTFDTNTLTILKAPLHGVASVDIVDGNIDYTPTAGYTGTDEIIYGLQTSDGQFVEGVNGSDVLTGTGGLVSITLSNVESAAVAVNDDVSSVVSGGTTLINVVGNDTDPDTNDVLSENNIIIESVTGGTATVVNGLVQFVSDPSFVGTPSISYHLVDKNDSGLVSNAAIISVVVTANNTPVVYDQHLHTLEETPLTVNLQAFDVEGDTLTWDVSILPNSETINSVATDVVHGTLTGIAPNLTYTPEENYFIVLADNANTGNHLNHDHSTHVQLEFTVTDSAGNTSATGVVEIGVGGVQDSPILRLHDYSDSYNTLNAAADAGTTLAVTVRENTTLDLSTAIHSRNVDKTDLLTWITSVAPQHGTTDISGYNKGVWDDTEQAQIVTPDSFSYSPAANYYGSDTFTAKVYDPYENEDSITLTITVEQDLDTDTDGDGVPDSIERDDGTDENDNTDYVDTDGDGVPDRVEGSQNTDPNVKSEFLDSDGDGVPDYIEDRDGTDKTDPNNWKDDNSNGFSNYQELNNIAPTIASAAVTSATEDVGYSYTLTATDSDADDTLTYRATVLPSWLNFNSVTQLLSGAPPNGNEGSHSVTLEATDGMVPVTQSFIVTVAAVNDPPSITSAASVSAIEDIAYIYTPVVLDVDDSNNGSDLVWSLSGEPDGMSVSDRGVVTWLPTEGVLTSAAVTIIVADGGENGAASATEVFTISVTAINDAPVAIADSYGLDEGDSLTVNAADGLVVNDTDEDRDGNGAAIDSLSAVLLTGTSSGELILNADGSFTYQHDGSEVAVDDFTYQASDGVNLSNTVTVTLNITEVNDAPHAQEDTFVLDEGASLALQMIANDSDSESDALTIDIVLSPAFGTLSNHAGVYTYQHDGTQNFFDSFSYRVQDARGAWSNTVLVNLNINPLNDLPVSVGDSFSVDEDSSANPLTILSNDSDEEGAIALSSLRIVDEPLHGSVSVQIGTGIVLYTPESNYNGPDSFTYSVSDLSGSFSIPGTVNITVTAVNDKPTTLTDVVNVGENTVAAAVVVDVLINDDNRIENDIDLTKLVIDANPLHGVAVIIGSGTNPKIQYTPNSNGIKVDSLRYTIADNAGLISNTTDVHINLIDAAIQPKALPDTFNNVETDGSITYAIDVVANDDDADGDANVSSFNMVTLKILQAPLHGVASIVSGKIEYTPAAGYTGTDEIIYGLQTTDGQFVEGFDGTNFTGTGGLVSITLSNVESAAVAVNDDVSSVASGGTTFINVVGNDTDPDTNDVLSENNIIIESVTGGTATVVNGLVQFVSDPNFVGTPSISYHLVDKSDSNLISNTASISIVVTANNAPVVYGQHLHTLEETPLTMDLQAFDVEGDTLTWDVSILPNSEMIGGVAADVVHGTLTGTAPNLTYTPEENYFIVLADNADTGNHVGHDHSSHVHVAFTVTDSAGNTSATAVIEIGVGAVQDAPILRLHTYKDTYNDWSAAADAGTTLSVTVRENTTLDLSTTIHSRNVDITDKLSWITSVAPSSGTTNISGYSEGVWIGAEQAQVVTPDNFSYTPTADYYGSDTFTAQVYDPYGNHDEITISVTIVQDMVTDTDGDGVPDSIERDQGTDPSDPLDMIDTDGDGFSDYIESLSPHLTRGSFDKKIIDENTDSDGNGIPNTLEQDFSLSGNDSDFDGIDDNYDVDVTGGVDTNNDGIDDALLTDTDANGIADIYDLDNDGDGIPDVVELGGFSFPIVLLDTDSDGTANYNDRDSDNDGASDLSESQVTTTFDGASHIVDDDNGDGISNVFDVIYTGGVDDNGDGVDDSVIARDTDSDGISDYLDLDSDNDGLLDVQEIGLRDLNGDGFADPNQNIIEDLPDTDNDGYPDLRDITSHGGAFDLAGTFAELFDVNNDGAIDDDIDVDRDGIMDVVDGDITRFGSGISGDHDGDGILDHVDLDDDGDGILDADEGHGDTDQDGIIDRLDFDSDNDGISDLHEGSGDIDGDGIPNYLDLDTDGDGISDNDEQMLVPPLGVDSDMDGIDDAYDVDVTGGVDENSDGIDDDMFDLSDMDGDGLLNYQDTNSDGDPYPDADENGDYNDDGILDYKQLDPGVSVSVSRGGGGSVSWMMLLAGMLLLIVKDHTGASNLKRRRTKPLLFVVALLCANVQAQDNILQSGESSTGEFEGSWYVGAGLGVSHLNPDENNTAWNVETKHHQAFGLHAGYHFLPDWVAELSYVDLGNTNVKNNNPKIGSETLSYKVSALTLGYDIYTTADKSWDFYLKGGVSNVRGESRSSGLEITEDSSYQLILGGGGRYHINKNWFTQIEFNSYSSDVQYFGLSLSRSL